MAEGRRQAERDDEPVILGRISGLFGVKGWVRVYSYTDPVDGLLAYSSCLLKGRTGWDSARIAEGQRHGKGIIVRLRGINDRDQAAALVGQDIAVSRDQLPDPEDGSYYWADLVGLAVEQTDGTPVGRVDHLLATGANDVLVVRAEEAEKEILIPFLTESVIKNVDLAEGRIVVDWEWG